MTRQEYAELKLLAKQLSEGLRDPSLSPETRAQAQLAAAGLAGKLCSIWFPLRGALMGGLRYEPNG
jgi:hypothetical protein